MNNQQFDPYALQLLYDFNRSYDVIASYHFDSIREKKVLGEKKKICRFCHRSSPLVTFKTEAHAIPQFLGNKYLISNYECDSCNKFFSEILEDEMARFMKPLHTVYSVKGEKKVPVFKSAGLRIETDTKKHNIKIAKINGDDFHDFSQEIGKGNIIVFQTATESFIPIAVFKCLVKMALTIMPEAELVYFSEAFEWLIEKQHTKRPAGEELPVLLGQLNSDYLFPHLSATVSKMKDNSINHWPNYILKLCYSKFSFQIYLPFCKLDHHRSFNVESILYQPHIIDIQRGIDTSDKRWVDFSFEVRGKMDLLLEISEHLNE